MMGMAWTKSDHKKFLDQYCKEVITGLIAIKLDDIVNDDWYQCLLLLVAHVIPVSASAYLKLYNNGWQPAEKSWNELPVKMKKFSWLPALDVPMVGRTLFCIVNKTVHDSGFFDKVFASTTFANEIEVFLFKSPDLKATIADFLNPSKTLASSKTSVGAGRGGKAAGGGGSGLSAKLNTTALLGGAGPSAKLNTTALLGGAGAGPSKTLKGQALFGAASAKPIAGSPPGGLIGGLFGLGQGKRSFSEFASNTQVDMGKKQSKTLQSSSASKPESSLLEDIFQEVVKEQKEKDDRKADRADGGNHSDDDEDEDDDDDDEAAEDDDDDEAAEDDDDDDEEDEDEGGEA